MLLQAVLAGLLAAEAAIPGHVFILHTDIRYMACDSWLLPVTKSMHVDRQWGLTAEDVPARPEGWGSGVRLVKGAGSSAPRPTLTRPRSAVERVPWRIGYRPGEKSTPKRCRGAPRG